MTTCRCPNCGIERNLEEDIIIKICYCCQAKMLEIENAGFP